MAIDLPRPRRCDTNWPPKIHIAVLPVPATTKVMDGTRIHAMAGVEYTAFKDVRRYWRDELQLNRKAVLPVAYWRRGRSEGEVVHDGEDD